MEVTNKQVQAVQRGLLTIADIQTALAGSLPGLAGQMPMAPERPAGQPNRWDTPQNCREAGVLIMLYPHRLTSELHFVLIRRPEYPGVHSGQIALPGGRREGSESLEQTALRETKEEIGVRAVTLEVIGALSPLYTPPSNFCIYPFVAYSLIHPTFQPDPREVAEVVEVPLRLLLDLSIRRVETWHFEQIGARRVPFFDVYGHHVWGATAMILSEFITMLDNAYA